LAVQNRVPLADVRSVGSLDNSPLIKAEISPHLESTERGERQANTAQLAGLAGLALAH
jgi:hypothetical protein